MRRISLAHLTVLDADPIGLIDAGKKGGFDAVGLRIVPPLRDDTIIPVVGDAALQKRIKQSLSDMDMEILDIEAIWIRPDTNIHSLREALEVGRDLGARYVLTVGFDENRQRLTENFGGILRTCQFVRVAYDAGVHSVCDHRHSRSRAPVA